jgi:hypothetical protein
LKIIILIFMALVLTVSSTYGASYYCDPSTGSMSNPGTLDEPWSTLQEVFDADKTFSDGDVIYLRAGKHGFPTIKGSHASDVTITRYDDEVPVFDRVEFSSGASHWVLDNVQVHASYAPPDPPILEHPVSPVYNNTFLRYRLL